MQISDNKYVTVTYDLNVGEGEERELMERATAQQPLEFIFGTNSMLEAFENQLRGLSQGDKFSFRLTPEEAYGDYDDTKVLELPKNIFEIDGKIDGEVLFEGNTLPMMDSSGNRLMGSVVSIGDEVVTMDFNHPLAGEIMHFEGTVMGVREASVEEIAALFSGGCGCGSGGCGSGEEGGCGCGSSDESMSGGCGCGSGGCGSC
ncbi:FKBP-type peptidyl-prolyl cis-trans isomerase 2 [Proteiniphilum saccharofermentans]|uniref:Peptidyl-prolyl cis-trans isomerase n=1 Tax=Proteiniphilum saccharofermentans TaxID=1642647 RepID=A0A1R3SV29_9BACT|nr:MULTISPECIES: FKBP-type peptidyl-prolyl cis-trans isomerase [Proteiniphilum]MDY9919823.1 FKBP-type peptidyl-prolyl cis-trans isomerase [Proteiniphilum sp.]SCD20166.1 FKBP-type peptidyl-prolyl cis-trans isomerase 2 [Proteiniphilum saccharofermentans]SEA33095.1 FKBP-type peptidyl-prolyl cis-trans isomerase SlyD [Porphyromonadaceae bacterium KH3R12]SFS97430.1 FKBP-type peptidyl-prolyl cis-trans isomerase SlyD [Porphyromonadaceae bacterium NLAE-zl-C104]